jgi:hypothetical protein
MTIFFPCDKKRDDIEANLRKNWVWRYATSAFRIQPNRMLMVTQRFGVYYSDYLQGEWGGRKI